MRSTCHTKKPVCLGVATAALLGLIISPAWAETTVDFGGYVKMDAHFSDVTNRAANDRSEAFMIPALIPLDGQEDSRNVTRYSVRESRVNLRTQTPTGLGDLTTFLEVDFLEDAAIDRNRLVGNQPPRLRHAFGQLGNWLAGQTWGTFYNVTTKPETLDFVGPAGTVFNRNIQVRYTLPLEQGNSLMLAVEQPFTTLASEATLGEADPGDAIRNARDDRWPEFVARYNVSGDWGHGSLAGVARNLRVDRSTSRELGADVDDDEWVGALSLTGVVKAGGRNDVRFQLNYGDGLGRYLGLNAFPDAFIDDQGNLDSLSIWGGYVSYRHWWNQTLRSSLVYSLAKADNPSSAPETANEQIQSVHLNLIYTPVQNVDVGVEYIWAEREIEGEDAYGEDSGELNRVQVSAKYSF
ncbi:DcaP family trimeric outer membrane transporter [Alkalilimnicola ehrlichii MLHE-1]|uniref:Porin n=1 Tax=Alkalilimnicola ehrlichii (strain ATCC BAA-1101 / DSM 17681 / MLHE-1) TaxID=187272 RepID=Q0A5P6_ALKEH|nr:DcaP family trimeric outer membrane transporter [Alkalilimnicola ehrlichii]ABI57841.1 conserved hypothetical protein [Alkalilimnicola ehrlichii MLHE-1]